MKCFIRFSRLPKKSYGKIISKRLKRCTVKHICICLKVIFCFKLSFCWYWVHFQLAKVYKLLLCQPNKDSLYTTGKKLGMAFIILGLYFESANRKKKKTGIIIVNGNVWFWYICNAFLIIIVDSYFKLWYNKDRRHITLARLKQF